MKLFCSSGLNLTFNVRNFVIVCAKRHNQSFGPSNVSIFFLNINILEVVLGVKSKILLQLIYFFCYFNISSGILILLQLSLCLNIILPAIFVDSTVGLKYVFYTNYLEKFANLRLGFCKSVLKERMFCYGELKMKKNRFLE